MTLERKDNNKDYCPENCCWATWHDQQRNKQNNRYYEFQGERLVLADWAKKLKIGKNVLRRRLIGWKWPVSQAFTTPVRQQVPRGSVSCTFRGERLLLAEWSRRLQISHATLRTRILELGWSVEKAFTTPARKMRRNGQAGRRQHTTANSR